MTDRTLVLRFLAFYEKTYKKAKDGIKSFLNEFCRIYREPGDEKLKEFESKFSHAMKACKTVFGTSGFRLRERSRNGDPKDLGAWTNRVNASIFQVVSVAFTEYDLGSITRRADLIYEEFLDLLSTDAKWVEYVTVSTANQDRIQYVFETWISRLNEVMKGEIPNDNVRVFSSSLKKKLWEQDKTCSICGQQIKIIDDAALDHVLHYWRGGQTVPTNARLAHRLCNLQRSK